MSSAKVFAVSELLEEILLNTPQRDILLLQRVSHFWHSVITNCPRLQHRLFFRAAPESQTPELNALLCEVFPPFFVLDIVPDIWENCRQHNNLFEIKQLPWYQDNVTRGKVMRGDASWRKMFPVQPPARIEGLRRVGGCQCGGIEHTNGWVAGALLEREDKAGGVTMGGLWDLVVRIVDTVPDGEFFVEWMGFSFVVKSKMYGNEVHEEVQVDEEDDDDYNSDNVEVEVVARRNAIALHFQWSTDCYPPGPVPCGMVINESNEVMYEFEKHDL